MKKLMIAALVIIAGAALTLSSCGSKMGGQVEGKSYKTEGWVDANTYRLTSTGCPGKLGEGKPQTLKRKFAREAARLDAQRLVLIKFKGEKVEAAAGMKDFEVSGVALAAEVEGTVKGGSVIKETYQDDDCCEIVYEVKAKNLKKKVQAAEIK